MSCPTHKLEQKIQSTIYFVLMDAAIKEFHSHIHSGCFSDLSWDRWKKLFFTEFTLRNYGTRLHSKQYNRIVNYEQGPMLREQTNPVWYYYEKMNVVSVIHTVTRFQTLNSLKRTFFHLPQGGQWSILTARGYGLLIILSSQRPGIQSLLWAETADLNYGSDRKLWQNEMNSFTKDSSSAQGIAL